MQPATALLAWYYEQSWLPEREWIFSYECNDIVVLKLRNFAFCQPISC